jgi:hypothetical protein
MGQALERFRWVCQIVARWLAGLAGFAGRGTGWVAVGLLADWLAVVWVLVGVGGGWVWPRARCWFAGGCGGLAVGLLAAVSAGGLLVRSRFGCGFVVGVWFLSGGLLARVGWLGCGFAGSTGCGGLLAICCGSGGLASSAWLAGSGERIALAGWRLTAGGVGCDGLRLLACRAWLTAGVRLALAVSRELANWWRLAEWPRVARGSWWLAVRAPPCALPHRAAPRPAARDRARAWAHGHGCEGACACAGVRACACGRACARPGGRASVPGRPVDVKAYRVTVW